MLNTNFSPWPKFSEEEAEAVSKVLLSNRVNYWTGEECQNFELDFAHWVGVKYSVALSNGTLALDLSLKALGIGLGDEVIVTPRSFIASVSCVVNAGANPIFADVDINSGNISAETISQVITDRTKAIIVVHLGGFPCDMDPIMDLATRHNIAVIEDCAQAHGALYKGRSVGSIGHIGAWSFCQDKIMTTGGEGGMVTTNDEGLWQIMRSFKDHGKNYDVVYAPAKVAGYKWVHESFGTNWRMLEIQAILGRIQLTRMPMWSKLRRKNAAAIHNVCSKYPAIRIPFVEPGEGSVHAYYKCYVYVDENALAGGWTRNRIIETINAFGVPCYHGSCPEIYLEKAFENTGWRPLFRLPVAQLLGESSMVFLVHPTLSDEEVDKTCTVLDRVLSLACP